MNKPDKIGSIDGSVVNTVEKLVKAVDYMLEYYISKDELKKAIQEPQPIGIDRGSDEGSIKTGLQARELVENTAAEALIERTADSKPKEDIETAAKKRRFNRLSKRGKKRE